MAITQERLKELITYDPETGDFMGIRPGTKNYLKTAGTAALDGYIRIRVDYQSYLAHRLAWLYVYGTWPDQLDHINMEKFDNRISNLREASSSINGFNTRKRSNNTSGFKGVSFYGGAWRAYIHINRKKHHLGTFPSAEEAAKAYQTALKGVSGGQSLVNPPH